MNKTLHIIEKENRPHYRARKIASKEFGERYINNKLIQAAKEKLEKK
jgi:hypothetical protein